MGIEMAFVGDSAVMATGAVAVQSEVSSEAQSKPTIAARDLRRVRIAIGATVALLIVDLALYIPRLL